MDTETHSTSPLAFIIIAACWVGQLAGVGIHTRLDFLLLVQLFCLFLEMTSLPVSQHIVHKSMGCGEVSEPAHRDGASAGTIMPVVMGIRQGNRGEYSPPPPSHHPITISPRPVGGGCR